MIGFEAKSVKSSSNNKIRNTMVSSNNGRITSFFTPTKGPTLSTVFFKIGNVLRLVSSFALSLEKN